MCSVFWLVQSTWRPRNLVAWLLSQGEKKNPHVSVAVERKQWMTEAGAWGGYCQGQLCCTCAPRRPDLFIKQPRVVSVSLSKRKGPRGKESATSTNVNHAVHNVHSQNSLEELTSTGCDQPLRDGGKQADLGSLILDPATYRSNTEFHLPEWCKTIILKQ